MEFAGAVGSSAALIFGYLASLVFKPKLKGYGRIVNKMSMLIDKYFAKFNTKT